MTKSSGLIYSERMRSVASARFATAIAKAQTLTGNLTFMS
jgi:hypothetical protein